MEVLSDPAVIAPLPTASTQCAPWPVPGRGKCNHCHENFRFTNDEPVERTRPLTYEVYCPECKSPDTRVARTMPPESGYKTRYLECNQCGHDFKTIDRVAPSPDIHTR